MHWARVIREADNPEWTVVEHVDGSLTEVKVGIINDQVFIGIQSSTGQYTVVHDPKWMGDNLHAQQSPR